MDPLHVFCKICGVVFNSDSGKGKKFIDFHFKQCQIYFPKVEKCDKGWKCLICETISSSRQSSYAHLSKKHFPNEDKMEENEPKEAESLTKINKTISKRGQEMLEKYFKKFDLGLQCLICQKKGRTEWKALKHLKRSHLPNETFEDLDNNEEFAKIFNCDKCSAKFVKFESLNAHKNAMHFIKKEIPDLDKNPENPINRVKA